MTIEVRTQPATPAADAPASIDVRVATVDGEVVATAALHVRVEPSGLGAERAVALACARGGLTRDLAAPLGRPAATAACSGGEEALAHLVEAAALALDDTDLHLTIRRA
jgi:hypothetical protein